CRGHCLLCFVETVEVVERQAEVVEHLVSLRAQFVCSLKQAHGFGVLVCFGETQRQREERFWIGSRKLFESPRQLQGVVATIRVNVTINESQHERNVDRLAKLSFARNDSGGSFE